MAQNDMLKRYLDAGLAFTQMTRGRAEAIVKDLVKAGEVQRDQTQERVDELVDRSRRNTEQLIAMVRREITDQLKQLGLATKDDLARLESRIESASGGSTAPKAAPTPKAPGKAPVAKAPGGMGKKAAPAKKAMPAKKAPGVKKA